MIWLIGNRGMLGRQLEGLLSDRGLTVLGSDIEVDITESETLRAFSEAEGRSVGWIINCAAYTAVDEAENHSDLAFRINAEGVRNIAELAGELGARLIHISTDYVFNGKKEDGYYETDQPDPINTYGRSKLAGERHVRAALSQHYIIRPSWLYGKHGPNFVHTMLRLFEEREKIGIVSDQWGSPTSTEDLASVIGEVIEYGTLPAGTYHYSGEGRTTWYYYARVLYSLAREHGLLSKKVEISPLTTSQYPTPAARPANSYLFKDKIRDALQLDINPWENSLRSYIASRGSEG
jgi:dTDP-4-dehydrorhamnose reductase